MADIFGGILDVWEDAPTVSTRTADILRPVDSASNPIADLFRIFHPLGTAAPPLRQTNTGLGAKPLPTASFWERWVTEPLSRAGSAIGNFFTAPVRAVKKTALWFGGGLIVVLVVAVIGLVVVLRIVRTVEG